MSIVMKSLLPFRQTALLSPVPAIANKLQSVERHEDQSNQSLVNYIQTRGAARKYKRLERMRQLKARASQRRIAEAQNPKPKKQREFGVKVDQFQYRFLNERAQDAVLPPAPVDDVYFFEKYRKKRFSIEEILDLHRQIAHPDVLNQPDSLVTATIELNLKMKIKKKRYIEKIASTVGYPHPFSYQIRPRKIIALCKNEADQVAAKEAGAIMAGSLDIAQQLKSKQLTQRDFDHLVCHTDFLLEFSAVKGMKALSCFPSKQRGNFGDDIVSLVKTFISGVDYELKKNEDNPAFGTIDCHFGRLNMTNEQLRENLIALFDSVNRFKPLNLADNKQFFERVAITTPISRELFLLKFWDLSDDYEDPDALAEKAEEEESQSAKGA